MRCAGFGMGSESPIFKLYLFPATLPLCNSVTLQRGYRLPKAGGAVVGHGPVGGSVAVFLGGAHGRRRIAVVQAYDLFSVAAPAAHVAEAVQSTIDRTLSLRMHDGDGVR